ncbi:YueI family protein [Salibacterium aidingense]|uniref:YueI family protein n=1 Tax=Salibacterium aidingense TaxID=384933 RepID=UPI003BCC1108
MADKQVNDYLEEGIYGPKEVKPDEKRRFLGTYRERVLLALTKKQVMKKGTFPQVEELLQKHSDAIMVVNGKLGYQALSAYTKLASNYGIHARRVTSMDKKSDVGLVIAKEYAVHREVIFVEEEADDHTKEEQKRSWWRKLLGME